jgi:hypothetical protein
MSNLKQFTSKVENAISGEIISSLKDEGSFYESLGYLKVDGSVVIQNTYSTLFQYIGLIDDLSSNPATTVSSGTSNNINDVIYANNTYVYVGNNRTLATSTDANTWTQKGENVTYTLPVLTYVGGKTLARAGSTTTQSLSLTDLTGGTSSAPAAGDIVFIAVATGSTALRSQAVSGYTQIASLYEDTAVNVNLWVGYKVMGSTPDTTVTIPASGATTDAQTVAIQVWKNVHPDIFDVTSTTSTIEFTVIPNPPSITTVSSNTVLLVVGAGAHANGTQTYTASYLSNFLTIGSNDDNDSTIGFGSIARPTAGTYDPAAFTFSGSDSSAYSSAAVTIAVKSLTYDTDNYDINTITHGNNTFVIGGSKGIILSSPNTDTWTQRTLETTNSINDIIYANNSFVAVGDNGTLLTSSNANTWISRTSGTSVDINALLYANNTYVYVGDNGAIATSSNAISWLSTNIEKQLTLTYVGGKTFANAGSTLTNTISLTDLTGGLTSAPEAGDVVFIAVAAATDNRVPTFSVFGVSGYTQIASLAANDTEDTYLWVGYKVMGSTPDIEVTIPASGATTDAQTVAIQVWRNVHPDIFDVTRTVFTQTGTGRVNPPSITTVSSNTVLLVVGAGAHTLSTQTYTASYLDNFLTIVSNSTNDSTIGFGSIARPIAGTYDPEVWTFPNDDDNYTAASVTIAIKPRFENLNDIIYADNTFVVVGDTGTLLTSPNAIVWTEQTSGTSNNINTLVYNGDLILYAGNSGTLRSSKNFTNWTLRNSGTTQNINSSLYNNSSFILVGNSGTIRLYEPYSYDIASEFKLPTLKTSNTFFDLYIKP